MVVRFWSCDQRVSNNLAVLVCSPVKTFCSISIAVLISSMGACLGCCLLMLSGCLATSRIPSAGVRFGKYYNCMVLKLYRVRESFASGQRQEFSECSVTFETWTNIICLLCIETKRTSVFRLGMHKHGCSGWCNWSWIKMEASIACCPHWKFGFCLHGLTMFTAKSTWLISLHQCEVGNSGMETTLWLIWNKLCRCELFFLLACSGFLVGILQQGYCSPVCCECIKSSISLEVSLSIRCNMGLKSLLLHHWYIHILIEVADLLSTHRADKDQKEFKVNLI